MNKAMMNCMFCKLDFVPQKDDLIKITITFQNGKSVYFMVQSGEAEAISTILQSIVDGIEAKDAKTDNRVISD